MKNRNVFASKNEGKTLVETFLYYDKCNIRSSLLSKLWWCLALASLLFSFGCKQANNRGGRAQGSNELSITIKTDAGYTFKEVDKPGLIKVKKGAKWADTKEKVLAKIKLKDGYEETGWKLGSKNGSYLEDSFVFNENATIFATSKGKTVTYKVEHLQENKDDDEYTTHEIEEIVGEAGKNTNAEAKKYENFVAQSFAQSLIKADGSTIIQIKYKRKITSLILNLDGGETSTKLESGKNGNKLLRGKFGAKVKVKDLTKENHGFEKWEPSLPDVFPIKDDTEHIYTAKWVRDIITLTITGDKEVSLTDPNTIKIGKGATWADIKSQVENIASPKENFEIDAWHLKDEDGELITNERIFKIDETVFAKTKRKVVSYKVEHLQENKDDDEYTKHEIEEMVGEAGTNTNAKAKTYKGFIAQFFAQSLIKEDGSTVIQIKYTRKITSLILNLDGGETKTELEDGKDGNKLLKGKFGAKVEVKEPTKEDYVLKKWEPLLPDFFPEEDDTEHIYTAKWKDSIQINIMEGDERLTMRSPVELPFKTGMTWADIKEKMVENVSLKAEWQGGDYELYDWKCENDEGDEITDEKIAEDGMKVYPRSNYAKFKWDQYDSKLLIGYTGEKPKGKIIIPIKTTKIKERAFKECIELTAVDFRGCSELKEIGYCAFSDCNALKTVNLRGCGELTEVDLNSTAITSIDLSPTPKLTKIDLRDTGITSIDLSSCQKIEHIRFGRCKKLKSVNLTGCSELTQVYLGVTAISKIDLSTCPKVNMVGFEGCKKLVSVNLSGCRLEQIYDYQFADCSALKTITLTGCRELTRVDLSNTAITSIDLSTCPKIEYIKFKDCKKLKSVNLTGCSRLKDISELVFKGCSALETVNLTGCSELTKIDLEYTAMKNIDLSTCPKMKVISLRYCRNLESVNLRGCEELTEVDLPDTAITSIDLSSCPKIKDIDFRDCENLESVNLRGCGELTHVFLTRTAITSIDLSTCSKVKQIDFSDCKNLESVNLTGCSELLSVNLSETSITSINLSSCPKVIWISFYDCKKLENVNLRGCGELEEINKYTFKGCRALEIVNLKGCSKLKKIDTDIFEDCKLLKTVNLTGCSELSKVVLSYTAITSIDLSTCPKVNWISFTNCKNLENVNLTGCNELTHVYLGGTAITSIDLSMRPKLNKVDFEDCKKLKSVNLEGCSELKQILDGAFDGCIALETVNLKGTSIEEIKSGVFKYRTKAEVRLPESITTIEDDAFGNSYYCCKEVQVPDETIKELVKDSGYPEDRIKMY